MYQFTINASEAGQRFNKYLQKLLPAATSSFLYKMLRKKNIELNGGKAAGNEVLKSGDTVKLFFSEETFQKFQAASEQESRNSFYEKAFHSLKGISVIYENEHILLLNKPEGILTQKAKEEDLSLNEWMIGYLLAHKTVSEKSLQTFKPSVCNRLDRNTSGLVICARTLMGSQKLNEMIKTRAVRKYYRLFVKGRLTEEVSLKGYLVKDEKTNRVSILKKPVEGSSYIETRFYPLQIFSDMTYLEVELITGKTHQIRAHMASIGHPLLMDYKYGEAAFNHRYEKLIYGKGQLLHACRLEFPPCSILTEEEPHVFLAPEPDAFVKLLKLKRTEETSAGSSSSGIEHPKGRYYGRKVNDKENTDDNLEFQRAQGIRP